MRQARPDVGRPQQPPGRRLRRVMSTWPSGVAVVGASSQGRVDAMTIDTLTSVCLEPETVLVCLASGARTTRTVLDSGRYCVSILGADHAPVARRFAVPGARRFPDEDLVVSADGQVHVVGAVATLHCRVVHQLEAGDHVVVLGEVTGARVRGGPQLVHCEGSLSRLVLDQARADAVTASGVPGRPTAPT